MSIHGLNHYNIRADQATLDKLIDFYTTVLGLRVGERPAFDSVGYWMYAGARPLLHLNLTEPDEAERTASGGLVDHVAFDCTDLPASSRRLQEHGVPFTSEPVPGTGRTQFFLRDPAGNLVELQFDELAETD